MFEIYNKLFDIYLRICKRKYDISKPYDNLEECCITCERFSWELSGMLSILEEAGEITRDNGDEERQRIYNAFSTDKLYNAYMENDRKVMVWVKPDCTV